MGYFGQALRQVFRSGYHWNDLWADVMAGFTVAMLAVPMTMAVAVACGIDPKHGLYAAAIASPMIAILGGSRLSISGPVAELVVLTYPVIHDYGFGGLMVATWFVGMILVMMGIGKLGRVIEFIPYSVTTGFIAGTAVVIASLQLQTFFGLQLAESSPHFLERILALIQAAPTGSRGEAMVGSVTLGIMILWPKLRLPIHGHLIAMIVSSLLAYQLSRYFPSIRPCLKEHVH